VRARLESPQLAAAVRERAWRVLVLQAWWLPELARRARRRRVRAELLQPEAAEPRAVRARR
jgi:hypothetical protein